MVKNVTLITLFPLETQNELSDINAMYFFYIYVIYGKFCLATHSVQIGVE